MDYSIPHYIKEVDSFVMDGLRYVVRDHFYPKERCTVRTLGFYNREMTCSYVHSSVHLGGDREEEPSYPLAQQILKAWNRCGSLDNVLVMGCAGCTIPRYLVRNFKRCRITGLEYSAQMIEIAKKYFFIDQFRGRFDLIQEDAFRYFSQDGAQRTFDVVYVDLFNAEKIPEEVFTPHFVQEQQEHLAPGGISITNLLDCKREDALRFGRMFTPLFEDVMLVEKDEHLYLVAIRGNGAAADKFRRQFTGPDAKAVFNIQKSV